MVANRVDGYTMGGPLCLTFSKICMVKMENNFVKRKNYLLLENYR